MIILRSISHNIVFRYAQDNSGTATKTIMCECDRRALTNGFFILASLPNSGTLLKVVELQLPSILTWPLLMETAYLEGSSLEKADTGRLSKMD